MHDLKLIGSAEGLEEGGKGFRFDIKDKQGEVVPAFVIKYDYQFFAYKNKCGHIAIQLDYMPGEFFNELDITEQEGQLFLKSDQFEVVEKEIND